MIRAPMRHPNRMRTTRKTISALLILALLLWYGSPRVRALLCEPISRDAAGAFALSVSEGGARQVRTAGDERLASVSEASYTVRLFGLLPVRTVGASEQRPDVLASGRAIGIVLYTEGVQLVGLAGVQTDRGSANPARDAGLAAGDTILSVDGHPVTDSNAFAAFCNTEHALSIAYLRDGVRRTVSVQPARDADGVYRIGAWVRDSTSGIGTLSFADPSTGRYAALGHGVSDIDTGALLSLGSGNIFSASITDAMRAARGNAGELSGVFPTDPKEALGTIERNTGLGIAGKLTAAPGGVLCPIAGESEVRLGDAEILSTVSGDKVRAYRVRVIRTDVESSPEALGMMIEVTDPDLLTATGGIVQGMSGSPVIQNGKLIGVVTHVFLNDSRRGYCLYASRMYDKLL